MTASFFETSVMMALSQIEMSAEQVYALKATITLWMDRRMSGFQVATGSGLNLPTYREPDIAAVDQRGNPCMLAHPSSFYSGEAISTRGMRYHFWTRDEGYGAMRQETRGRLRIGRSVTPPPALKSAIRLALAAANKPSVPADDCSVKLESTRQLDCSRQWKGGSGRPDYAVGPTPRQPVDISRELAAMNSCPLVINRRVSSARALISSLHHS
jgi:hypothetical protein